MLSVEARLQLLEDRAEIADLLASYGPIVDSGDGQRLAEIWATDGVYVVGDEFQFDSDQVTSLTELPGHQQYLSAGCGHVLSPPKITIDGDTAVAINYSMVLVKQGELWVADRLSANRWELQRTATGWRVSLRKNHLLDGNAAARELLAGR